MDEEAFALAKAHSMRPDQIWFYDADLRRRDLGGAEALVRWMTQEDEAFICSLDCDYVQYSKPISAEESQQSYMDNRKYQ